MTPRSPSNDAIVQEISIQAPARRIFAALTDPDELLKWWRLDNEFRLVRALCDLRPGGKWTMRVKSLADAEQRESIVHGVYITVEPPHQLTYTWIREEDGHPETTVRWDLSEFEGVTRVRITHSGLTTERLRQRNSGWIFIVQLLKDHMEG